MIIKKSKYILFFLGWIISYFIPLHYLLNDVLVSLEGCTQGSTDFFTETTIINIILFAFFLILVHDNYKILYRFWYIGLMHVFSLIFLFCFLSKYFIYTTIYGISPCIVFDYSSKICQIDFSIFKFENNILLIDRLYAPVGFFIIITCLYFTFRMYNIKFINSTRNK